MQVSKTYRLAALSAAVIAALPFAASAQLEEIIVTATRRETDLQSTPLSVAAFTAEQLELGGITNGRDLGIMVPNVVLESRHRRCAVAVLHSRPARRRLVRRRRLARRLRLPADEFLRDGARRGLARPARHAVRPQHERRRGQHDHAPAGRRVRRARQARCRRLQPPRRIIGRRRADHGELENEVHDGDRQERRLPRGTDDAVGLRLARRHDLSRRHPVGAGGHVLAALHLQRRAEARHGSEDSPHDALRQLEALRVQHHARRVPSASERGVRGRLHDRRHAPARRRRGGPPAARAAGRRRRPIRSARDTPA